MFWQREVIRNATAMTFAQTWELDLPKTGFLGSIGLYFSSTQNGQPFLTAVKWRLIDYISKIEIIGDGSTIIKSFDGRQALASCFYDQGVVPPSMWRHYSNTPHRQWLIVNFGNRLFDVLRALDLSSYEQIKLRITNDATATQFTTDIKVTVVGYFLREPRIAPRGYYREEEWKTFTPVADTWEYTDLPTALPIARILLRARPGVDTADALNNSSMDRLMHDIEFTLRTGQTRVYRGDLFTLAMLGILEQGFEPITAGMIDRTGAYGFETGIGYATNGLGAVGGQGAADATYGYTMKSADVQDSTQEMKQREADNPLEWLVRGAGYMHNVPLYVARSADLADLLDPAAENVVKVDVQCQSGTTVSGTDHTPQNGIILKRLVV